MQQVGRSPAHQPHGHSSLGRQAVSRLSLTGASQLSSSSRREPKRARRNAVQPCSATLVTDRPPQIQTDNGKVETDQVPIKQYTATKDIDRPRVVVLGSGWGAMSFVKAFNKNDSNKYELLLVSPRNYFLYTPLLPAVATGTVEQRSIVEPGKYYEAVCQDIDPKNKTIVACFPKDTGLDEACFRIPYDILVLAVGSVSECLSALLCLSWSPRSDKSCYRLWWWDHLLSTYDRAISDYTGKEFKSYRSDCLRGRRQTSGAFTQMACFVWKGATVASLPLRCLQYSAAEGNADGKPLFAEADINKDGKAAAVGALGRS
ncbi:hypothetical protein WJX84_011085 [Apatococcus fuscideae]|uniref:NADH:ubiquinone reductase (non-electrogenic) n=1 Tax=Apatococcus fuscideae TaxID=2026836 RepID=A0AAW1TDU1_9CHLO